MNGFALKLKGDGGEREAEKYSENADFTGRILEFHPNASSRVCKMGISPFCALVSQPAK